MVKNLRLNISQIDSKNSSATPTIEDKGVRQCLTPFLFVKFHTICIQVYSIQYSGEKTIADAILDRIVHDAHRIELKGESLRKGRDKYKEIETLN